MRTRADIRIYLSGLGFDDLGQYYDLPDDWHSYCVFCGSYIAGGEKGYLVYYGIPDEDKNITDDLCLECVKCRAKKMVAKNI